MLHGTQSSAIAPGPIHETCGPPPLRTWVRIALSVEICPVGVCVFVVDRINLLNSSNTARLKKKSTVADLWFFRGMKIGYFAQFLNGVLFAHHSCYSRSPQCRHMLHNTFCRLELLHCSQPVHISDACMAHDMARRTPVESQTAADSTIHTGSLRQRVVDPTSTSNRCSPVPSSTARCLILTHEKRSYFVPF